MAQHHRDTNFQVVTDAVAPTLTLATVKNYLRVTHTDDDTLIPTLIIAAIQHIENLAGISIFNKSVKMVLSDFPNSDTIELLKGPVNGSVVIKYDDTADAEQTYSSANYETSGNQFFPFVRLKDTASWPETNLGIESVRVEYDVGYDDEASIPESLVLAIMLLTSHFYDNRAPVVTTGAKPQALNFAIEALLDEYKRPKLP